MKRRNFVAGTIGAISAAAAAVVSNPIVKAEDKAQSLEPKPPEKAKSESGREIPIHTLPAVLRDLVDKCARYQERVHNGIPRIGKGMSKDESSKYWQSRCDHVIHHIEETAAAMDLNVAWNGIYPTFTRK